MTFCRSKKQSHNPTREQKLYGIVPNWLVCEKDKIVGTKETKEKLIFDAEVREEHRRSVMGGSSGGASGPSDKENLDNAHADTEGDEADDTSGSSSVRKCFSCCGRRQREDDSETCQESIIINQDGTPYKLWEFIVILSCIISSYMYMYLAAFWVPEPGGPFYILDYIFLAIFGCDIIIRKCTV